MRKLLFALFITLAANAATHAAVQMKTVTYRDGDLTLQGHFAWDDSLSGPRPGVIVVHEWWGLNEYAKSRARELAALGYAAFAIDMYGSDKVTDHPQQAQEWMTQTTANVDAWQRRALAGLEILKRDPLVDAERIAAIGYCFGGATVMQMAYAGADLDGVVSFHGSLPPATDAQAAKVRARVLVAHGEADAFIPQDRIARFKAQLDKGGVDWQMVSYGGARHAFTNPAAGQHGIDNLRYDPLADRRSWALMQDFLREALQ